MRAISSSTAFSTGTFSLTTRFIAFAHTFSLLRIVNFQFFVKSNGCVPPVNWVVDRLAMAVGLPERACLACGRHREPAAERALDIGPHVFFLEKEADELLAFSLVFAAVKISPVLTSERYLIVPPSGLCGKEAVMMSSS